MKQTPRALRSSRGSPGRGFSLAATDAVDDDASSSQPALAWPLQRSPTTLPILRTSRASHREQNVPIT